MPTTDVSERGLETLIIESLVNEAGYINSSPQEFDREHCLDPNQLMKFLHTTQPEKVARLGIENDGEKRNKFLHRLQSEIAKRGTIDVLRKGVEHLSASVELYYLTPSPENQKAVELYQNNIFSITRQLRYSLSEQALALDLCLFVNGLPIITFELKNSLTKQTVHDAMQQYRRDREPREPLFQFGRCIVHFAVDDVDIRMCTRLMGKHSWFLPFNKGY